jgi:Uma2 family endonuclease
MAVAHRKISVPADGPRPWRWTVEQYHQLAEAGWFDEKRVELLEGEIVEMPPIGDEHRAVGMGVIKPLMKAFGDDYEISIQSSLILNDDSEPEPDVVVARGSWRDFVNGLPLEKVVLIAEIAKSTLRNDLSRKAQIYARAGIPEYWVIDLINRELVVHRQPEQGGENPHYAQVQQLKKGESIAPLHAPQSPVAVSDLML